MEPVSGLSLSLLGAFAASLNGRSVRRFRSNKVQALLIYLAVENRQVHRRDFLMELLWPGLPQRSAQVNLRQTIRLLKETIPALTAGHSGTQTVPFLLADRQTVQVHPDGRYELDVATFTHLLKGKPTPAELEQAVALYRGDFLADFYLPDSSMFEEWAAARREALRRMALDALERLADYHLQGLNYDMAEQDTRRQLEIDPLRESAYRQLMAVLAQSGRRRAAISHYETLRQLLQSELGIAPSTKTIELYEQIKDDKVGNLRLLGWQEPALSSSKGDRVTDTHDVTLSPCCL
jgi:DNA-binding SARP family transcriptional activator